MAGKKNPVNLARTCETLSGTGYCDDGLTQANRPITIGLNGQRHLQVKAEDAVKSLIYAWQNMKQYKRLLRWTWVSRGLVTLEEMQEMHPDIDPSELHSKADEPTPFSEIVPGVPLLVPCLGLLVRSTINSFLMSMSHSQVRLMVWSSR